jgi:hypothetical protein
LPLRALNSQHGSFERFLRRSLEVLSRELPHGYARVVALLGELRVKIEVDDERLGVVADGRDLSVVPSVLAPSAVARGSAAALRSILEGRQTLDQAILGDAIFLQGSLLSLAAFYETLVAYFNAAVRCPSFAGLLDEYLGPAGGSSSEEN